jgi:hypothetical protein
MQSRKKGTTGIEIIQISISGILGGQWKLWLLVGGDRTTSLVLSYKFCTMIGVLPVDILDLRKRSFLKGYMQLHIRVLPMLSILKL